MVLPILGANTESAAYDIANSLRFNKSDSPNVSNNPGGGSGSDGSRTQFSISMWVKRSSLGLGDNSKQQFLTSAVATNNFYGTIKFGGNDAIAINLINSGSDQDEIHTNAVFRDTSAWYHLFFAFDKTQASLADGVKLYVNGVLQTFGTTTYTQNQGYHFFRPGKSHYIGNYNGQEGYFDGYMAEVHFVDGQVKAHTDFGETNNNGVWIPKEYTGTHGTYGFYLEFKQTGTSENSSGIGADTSGNDEHFAVANLAATDVTTDTPTNNFATLNSLTALTHPELREGNLQQYEHGSTNSSGAAATIMPINGKWYAELFLNGPSGGDYPFFGITDTINLNAQGAQGTKMAAGFEIDGATNNQSTTNLGTITNTNTGWPSFSDNDIVMFALDCDNRKLWLGRNGTWINSGDPAAGSNQQLSWTVSDNVCPFLLGYDNSQSGGGGDESIWNYGNPPFSISSSNADANGYGNFEYAVPSGYYALCTKNLAEYG